MDAATTIERDRIVATSCTLALLMLVSLWLHMQRFATLPNALDDAPLRLVWIDPPPPAVRHPAPPPIAPSTPRVAAAPIPASAPRLSWHAPSPAATTPAPPSTEDPIAPDAATLLRQARDWSDAQSPRHDYHHNPLDRPAAFAEARPKRFRERPPPSPAQVVASIGEFFGGPGYSAGPCPRIRRDIAALSTGGDSELLQEALRREHQACAP